MPTTEAQFCELTARWLDAWNQSDLEGVLAAYADDIEYATRTSEAPLQGQRALRAFLSGYFAPPRPSSSSSKC